MKTMKRGAPMAPLCKASWNWGFVAGVAVCVAVWGSVAAAWWAA